MNHRMLGSQGLAAALLGLGCMSMSFVNIESRAR
jgi:aryl-alcohol dehydrogenase-like predicted oxidoreductase